VGGADHVSSTLPSISPYCAPNLKVAENHVNLGGAPVTTRFEVLFAGWGGFNNWTDVTPSVKKKVRQGALNVKLADLSLTDVAPSIHKTLVVVYNVRGKLFVGTLGDSENKALTLPAR
jgi:hypothetical protein